MGTLSMVLGASNGRVSCCSSSAARARVSAEGPSAATDPAIRASSPSRDERGLALLRVRGAVPGHPKVGVLRVGRQRSAHGLHRRDAVEQRVVHLGVHGEPTVGQTLDQVRLPQRPVPVEQGAVQPRGDSSSSRTRPATAALSGGWYSRSRSRSNDHAMLAMPPSNSAGCLRKVGWTSSRVISDS